MNKPVNFELAKLLKEKRFDEDCNFYYSGSFEIESFEYYHIDRKYSDYTGYPDDVLYFAPTITEVVMWLYEKHGIWISVDWTVFFKEKVWFYSIRQKNQSSKLKSLFNSPTEAYEAAITYTLTNLL